MPPSILSKDALVIWMFRMAINAPIMAAITEIQTVALARSEAIGFTEAVTVRGFEGLESARSDMTSPFVSSLISLLGGKQRDAGMAAERRRTHGHRRLLLRLNGRDHRHARTKHDA